MAKNWSTLQRTALMSMITFAGAAAISGIIGNRADILFGLVSTQILHTFLLSHGLPIFILIPVVSISSPLMIFWRRERARLQREISHAQQRIGEMNVRLDLMTTRGEIADQLFDLIEILFRSLPTLLATRNVEGEAHRILKRVLANATCVFPKVHSASLFLPDKQGEYLTIWEHYQISTDSITHAHCYIGAKKEHRKSGVAGEAFLTRELIVARRTEQKDKEGHWAFDRESYIPFIDEATYPAFSAIACVPLMSNSSGPCLGVVCLDSTDLRAFDAPEIQEILSLLGHYIALTLLICQEQQKKRPIRPIIGGNKQD